jgi:hypothetical protein
MTFSKQPCGSQNGGIYVVSATPSSIPEEPCLHEHIHDNGFCNDCGVEVDDGRRNDDGR